MGIGALSSPTISWAKSAIQQRYSSIEQDGGVDFNGDGQITGAERLTDLDGNGTVGNAGDYLAFLENNHHYIQNQISFVGAQDGLSAGNIVNQILFVESGMYTSGQVSQVYDLINGVIDEVSGLDSEMDINDLSPEQIARQRLQLVFEVLEEQGYKLENQTDPMFTGNILNHRLDCDTSSLIVLAVAEELGWPVQLMVGPHHVFARWEDEETHINIDAGEIYPDSAYRTTFGIPPIELSREGTLALYYTNIGLHLARQGHHEASLAAARRALELDPTNQRARTLCTSCRDQLATT